MGDHLWDEVAALEPLIRKAIASIVCRNVCIPEFYQDLLAEARLSAYHALKTYDPSRSAKSTWVYRCVRLHLLRVFSQYQTGFALPEEPETLEDSFQYEVPIDQGTGDLARAVLLATVPPSERAYVLYELMGWDRPAPYSKSRLIKRWHQTPWVCLLTGRSRGENRGRLLAELVSTIQETTGRNREIAGFALAAVASYLSSDEKEAAKKGTQVLVESDDPLHQVAGLWILHNMETEPWDSNWVHRLHLGVLGSVLESRYSRPKDIICPCPLCNHFYPDVMRRSPAPQVYSIVCESLSFFTRDLHTNQDWSIKWRGRLMAKAIGFYARCNPSLLTEAAPGTVNRLTQSLVSVTLARIDPQKALEHAGEWLPKGGTSEERVLKGIRSRDPIQRSGALYAARGLHPDSLQRVVVEGFQDPLVFVRFSALRAMEQPVFFQFLERELLSTHRHKRLFHRCVLNTMARADLERTLPLARAIYLGREKEEWWQDSWLRHDAGYILLTAFKKLDKKDVSQTFREVLEQETHPSPFVLLPAVQSVAS
ncbi:MAG: hypothetical protein NZ959_10110 [Armatimonadetes bacterium]|nr:hypothetical protein [Armatimonadota bacterium]MDW8122605.1 sigma factor [Armatimonadota bacterium]